MKAAFYARVDVVLACDPDRLSRKLHHQMILAEESEKQGIKVVRDTICQLIREPDFLIRELHKRNADNSQTEEILERELQLCQAGLKAKTDETSYREGALRWARSRDSNHNSSW